MQPAGNKLKSTLLWLTLYSIAMGYLECAVVIYLRNIYYPEGFSFPMTVFSPEIMTAEIIREAGTLVMLVSVASLAGFNFRTRFAWFIYSFAVWDIFYYIFLKLLIHWPDSLLTWDILFLLPTVWTGPVLVPLIISFTMIFYSFLLVFGKNYSWKPLRKTIFSILLVFGITLTLITLTADFLKFALQQYSLKELFNYGYISEMMGAYIPRHFNWPLFLTGEAMILGGLFFTPYLPFSYKAS